MAIDCADGARGWVTDGVQLLEAVHRTRPSARLRLSYGPMRQAFAAQVVHADACLLQGLSRGEDGFGGTSAARRRIDCSGWPILKYAVAPSTSAGVHAVAMAAARRASLRIGFSPVEHVASPDERARVSLSFLFLALSNNAAWGAVKCVRVRLNVRVLQGARTVRRAASGFRPSPQASESGAVIAGRMPTPLGHRLPSQRAPKNGRGGLRAVACWRGYCVFALAEVDSMVC